jgi:PAS domain S-box-containing protein
VAMVERTNDAGMEISGRIAIVGVGAVAVFLLALLGVEMTRAAGNVASIWLPNVVALAVILRVRGNFRLLAFLASGLAIFLANYAHGDGAEMSLGLTVANMIEIGVAATLLVSTGFQQKDIVETAGFFRFVAVAGLVAPLVGGVAGAFALQELVGAPFFPVFQTWVMSGVLGSVIIGPAIIAPITFTMDRRPLALWEIVGWSVASAGMIWLTTQSGFGLLIYLLPTFVIAAGVRLGLTASGLVGAVLATYVAWDVVTGGESMPFADDLLAAQVFLLTAITLSHVMALLWHQRLNVESEKENYVRAFHGSSDGILFVDAQDRFVAWNDTLEKIAPWMARHLTAGLPEFRNENLALLARLRSGEIVSEHPINRPDGNGGHKDLLFTGAPIFDGGIYQGATVTLRDVTEAGRLRNAARQRAAELESFIDSTPDLIIGTDTTGAITIWNRTAEKFHGLSKADALGKMVFDLGSTEDSRKTRYSNFRRVMAGDAMVDVQATRKNAEGVERTLLLSIRRVLDINGNVTGSVGHHRDVTDLVSSRQQAEHARLLLDKAFGAVSDGLAIFDADEILVRCNDAYADLIGKRDADTAAGITWTEILYEQLGSGRIPMPDEEWDDWINDRRRLIADGGNTFVMQLSGGQWLLASDYPISGGGFISVRQDVTELKRAEMALEVSNRELGQFAFVASHDLQEPLRKINSFGSILATEFSDDLPEEAQQYTEFMMRAASRMQNLIQDLLAYSRLESARGPVTSCSLSELARIAVGNMTVAIEDVGATIEVGSLGTARVERSSMIQVIENLIANSVTYRDPSKALEIRIMPVAAPPNRVSFSVKDNGIGFDMRYAAQILEPFKRLHSHAQIPGTGMGLPIVEKILRSAGGELQVFGKDSVGAEFTIHLPMSEN